MSNSLNQIGLFCADDAEIIVSNRNHLVFLIRLSDSQHYSSEISPTY